MNTDGEPTPGADDQVEDPTQGDEDDPKNGNEEEEEESELQPTHVEDEGAWPWKVCFGASAILAAIMTFAFQVDGDATREWGVEIIREFQKEEGAKDFLSTFSYLCNEEAMMSYGVLATFMYDFKYGIRFIYYLSLSIVLGLVLKDIFHSPRPGWVFSDISANCNNGTGFPSGHAIDSIAILGMVALLACTHLPSASPIFLTILSFISGAVGFSRIARGVHFPDQVIVGWLVGLSLLSNYRLTHHHIDEIVTNTIPQLNTTEIILICIATFGWGALVMWAAVLMTWGYWDMPTEWANGRVERCADSLDRLTDWRYAGVVDGFGVLGVITAIPLLVKLEHDSLPSEYSGCSPWKAVVRGVIALGLVFAVFMGVSAVFPKSLPFATLLLCRYFLRGMLIIGACGAALWLNRKLGLTKPDSTLL